MSTSPAPFVNSIDLDKVFSFESDSYAYEVHWTCLKPGNSTSSPTKSVVLVHGTPWSSAVWADTAQALAAIGYAVYLFDHAGFGVSPLRRALSEDAKTLDENRNHEATLDADLAGQSEVFANLLLDMGFGNAPGKSAPHIIAHDNGGFTVLRAALLHGAAYSSLCLIDVVAIGPFDTEFFQQVSKKREAFLDLPSNIYDGIVRSYVRAAAFRPLTQVVESALVEPWLEGGSQGPNGFWRQVLQASRRDISAVENKYVGMGKDLPIKIVWGAQDTWIPVDRAHRLGKAINAEEVVVVEEAGHLSMVDQPIRVAVEITAWLLKHS